MNQQTKKDAGIFKAFSDENRLNILCLLAARERCACELLDEVRIGQSTLSHHMKILCDAGIVNGRKDGKWVNYSINNAGVDHVYRLLKEYTQK